MSLNRYACIIALLFRHWHSSADVDILLHVQMPSELISKVTGPSFSKHEYAFVKTPLDFSQDYPLFHLNSSNVNVSIPKELFFVTPQVPINQTLSSFNEDTETRQSQYACDYEDPGGVPERGSSSPPRSLIFSASPCKAACRCALLLHILPIAFSVLFVSLLFSLKNDDVMSTIKSPASSQAYMCQIPCLSRHQGP
jgi:hypothetical protein